MTSRCGRHCHRHRSPAAGPLEDDDLLAEILLRLPPQPSSLPRASLVCKRWRRLISDPGFSRRFRRHHRRNPPFLGFFNGFNYNNLSFVPTLEPPNRVPPGRFSLRRGDGDRLISLGCRHGLVLIFDPERLQFVVWDPITGVQYPVPLPPTPGYNIDRFTVHGAVLRAAGDAQHFQVVLAVAVRVDDDKQHRRALACVYSSETGLWGDLISTQLPSNVPFGTSPILAPIGKPAVLVGDSLYWMLAGNYIGILEFDLEKQRLAVIRVPVHMLEERNYLFWIMRAEDGGLGLLFQTNHTFQLWKRKTVCDGVASWGLERTIELLSLDRKARMVGFAEENNVVFVWIGGVLFMVHLKSMEFKKLFETEIIPHYHPFESVYTAETDIGGEHDEADLLNST